MPVIAVEGPELVKETLVFQVFGILFHPQHSVGRCKSVFGAELETGPGAVGAAGAAMAMPSDSRIHIPGDLYSNIA